MNHDLIFHQLFDLETSTYTYLLADPKTKEAVLIDSVLEQVERDMKLIEELSLNLKYVLDTHIHADHITGAGEIRKRTGAKTGVSHKANVECADLLLKEGVEIPFGKHSLKVLETPGHTDSCLSFYTNGMVFTGDALLIRGTGRTDFQQGSSEKLYESLTKKLLKLPPDTKVYPAHDYHGLSASTIDAEMKFNPRIGGGKTKEEFKKIMSELKLTQPKKIHEAVPANLVCGIVAPEITAEQLNSRKNKPLLVDVRRPDEFNNELGHIAGSQLITLGNQLNEFLATKSDKNSELVFVCRSGARSAEATKESRKLGFTNTFNLKGGMLRWNELGFKVEREQQTQGSYND